MSSPISSEPPLAIKYPLLTPKDEPEKKTNTTKIVAIICAVVGVLLAGIAALCLAGILPLTILGGTPGIVCFLVIGTIIALPSAYFAWKHWKN